MSSRDANADKIRLLTVAIPADRRSAALVMQPGSGASGRIALTRKGLGRLIRSLGQVHATLEGPDETGDDEPPPGIVHARCLAAADPHGGSVLTVRHPTFGPLSVHLPAAEAHALVEALRGHLPGDRRPGD